MCEIEAVSGVKKKNSAVANFMAQQAQTAQDKMRTYDVAVKKFMNSGMSEPEAKKAAEQMIKDTAGASSNSGFKTNNDKDATVDKSRLTNERILGETNMKGELKTLVDASEDAGNNSDNGNSSGRKSDQVKMDSDKLPKGKIKDVSISLFGD